ncbi:MAG TPA: flavin reductase family protein [Streptosporangiaceae bacterium]
MRAAIAAAAAALRGDRAALPVSRRLTAGVSHRPGWPPRRAADLRRGEMDGGAGQGPRQGPGQQPATATGPALLTAAEFRRVLGHVPTGVAIVAGIDASGVPAGLSVGSFTSASLDPPLVAFFADVSSTSWPRVRASGLFCVSILGHDQEPASRGFARRGGDKFDGVRWQPSPVTGAPRLEAAHAWIDCRIERETVVGDHTLVVGEVLDLAAADGDGPLMFYRGGYHRLSPGAEGHLTGDAG